MITVKEDALCELELHLSKTTDDTGKLGVLASHENTDVRKNVVSNTYASPAVLVVLARDPDADVRMSAAMVLINRYSGAAASLAEDLSTPQDVLRILATCKDDSISCRAAGNPSLDPGTLNELSKIDDEVRWAVAENPSTPVPALRAMAEEEDLVIWQALVQNPSTPKDVIQSLKEQAVKKEDGHARLVTKFAEHRLSTGHAVENGYNITCPATGDICPMSLEG